MMKMEMVILGNRYQPHPPFPLIQAPINLGNQVAIPATADKTPFMSLSENVFLVVEEIMKWRRMSQTMPPVSIIMFTCYE